MHYISALCLLCVFAATLSRRVNYCGSKMCGNTDLHTFCQFPPGPSASCTGYIDAPLTKDEKSRLLARLNQRRNEAAHGHLRNMPSAGNMLKLRWIEELAEEAQLWADQCRPPSSPEEHDECRDLYSITVGQCVASVVGEAPGLRVESMVDMWYMQSLLYKGNVSSYVPPEYDRYFYGDFGQIMWASSYTVGCGRSRFMVEFEMDESVVVKNKMTIQEHILVNSVLEIDRNESINGLGSLDELYLTNLAIVTMNDIESSTLYNSIKKREAFDVKNNNVNVTDKHIELKTTRKAPDQMSPKISKKKLSTIGRPKTYNMEELNEIEDDHKENNYKITEDALKKFNDIYGDYNIVETQDENETTVTEAPRIEQMTDFIENGQTVDFRKSTIVFADTINNNNKNFRKETINTSTFTTEAVVSYITETKYIAANGTGLNVLTQTSFANADIRETLKPKEKSIDDYLTDPDTMQQLEHTLDRMEHKMQTSRITAKVRRELGDIPEEPGGYSSTTDFTNFLTGEEREKTIDKPVLNMMLKYMPYMKQYEGQLLSNSVGCLYSSLVLVCLSFCVVS